MINTRYANGPIAQRWRWLSCGIVIGMIIYMPQMMFAFPYMFTSGDVYGYFGVPLLMVFWIGSLIVFGQVAGKQFKYVLIGICFYTAALVNEIIMLVLILEANLSCDDSFDCPFYGFVPPVILILIFLLGMFLPLICLVAVSLSLHKDWNPRKIAEEAQEENVAQVVEYNNNPPNEMPYYVDPRTQGNPGGLYNQNMYDPNMAQPAIYPQMQPQYPNQPQSHYNDQYNPLGPGFEGHNVPASTPVTPQYPNSPNPDAPPKQNQAQYEV